MQLLRSIADVPESLRQGAVSIGNFDGVHRGHARIVERLKAMAAKVGGPAVVFTFDPHPVRLLRPDLAPPPLTWTDRKAELLAALGVDAVIAYPTDEALLSLSPQEFFDQIVREKLAARGMVEGPNFYFGRDRAGDVETLRSFCGSSQIELEIVDPLTAGEDFVSSSRIRRLIAAGDIDGANELLTQPYRLRGMVTHGAARGAKIGFPTANLSAIDTILPGMGVYAGEAVVSTQYSVLSTQEAESSEPSPTGSHDAPQASSLKPQAYPAAINVGPNPTFGEDEVKVEVHLIGFSGSLYGQPLEVDFSARLRDIQPFDGVEALKEQLARDVERAQQIQNLK